MGIGTELPPREQVTSEGTVIEAFPPPTLTAIGATSVYEAPSVLVQ